VGWRMFVVLQQQGTEELPDTAADTPRQLSMIALGRGLFKLNTQRPTVHDLLVVWFGLNASAAQLLNEADLQAELALFFGRGYISLRRFGGTGKSHLNGTGQRCSPLELGC
jgi:hypothetical protein